tara:strand:- start:640 stop:2886 length:2247 start_codon:yes stop_codon:yes gene_type:complete
MLKILSLSILIINLTISYCLSDILKQVEIDGNKRISKETIIVLGNINLNSNYETKDINELLKKLYASDFFENIDINFNNGLLEIDVIENYIIEDIQITGLKNKSQLEILQNNIKLKNRMSFTEDQLKKDINLIENFLKTSGYYFVQIKTSIVKNDDLNSVNLTLEIDQGPRAKIKEISFIGDKKIKDKKLLEVIASEEHKFWKFISNKVYLNQSIIELDKRLLENYYKNLGYYKVQIVNSFAQFTNEGNFKLTFNISAGKKYFFNNFNLNLPDSYDRSDFDKINNLFSKFEKKNYNLDDFNLILSEIEKIASSRLYEFIDAKVEEEIIDNKINFTFNVIDSNKFYVERINILGNYQTIEEVIRNKLIVDEGDPFNNLLFNKSVDNIKGLRLFKNVKSNIKQGSDENFKVIDIILEEQPTGEISLAAGVGTSGSTIGGGVTEKNFLGKGIKLTTNLELSDDTIKGQFVYSKPNFAYTDNTLNTSLIAKTDDFLSDYGYKVSETSFSIGTEYEQFEKLFFSPGVSISLEDLRTNSTASSELKKQEGTYKDLYFTYGLNYDLRNSVYRPSSGNVTSFLQEIPIASDNKDFSNTLIFTQYQKLNRSADMIGKASLYMKTITTLDNSDTRLSKRGQVPYSRLRGFEKGKVGPVDNQDYIGGNYVTALNLSTNLPGILNTVENVDFSYFIDFANVWGVDYNSSIDDSNFIRSSTGLGMNLLTPIGPLSFSFTKPIRKKSSDITETFRFNLGTTF